MRRSGRRGAGRGWSYLLAGCVPLVVLVSLVSDASGSVRSYHAVRAEQSRVVVVVTLSDGGIRFSRASVPPGPVSFRVTNKGSVTHDLVLGGHGRTRVLAPGATQTITLTLSAPGVYHFHSSLPRRDQARLGVSLRVSPALTKAPAPAPIGGVALTLVATVPPVLTFAVAPPGDTSRLMLVGQTGLVSLLKDGVLQATPFLDLRDLVDGEGEKGLLSLAFAPDYATSGLFYVYYNDRAGDVQVVEYRRSEADPDVADPDSARVVLTIDKPAADHNGGMMQFGPDGDLYIAVGDGGADPPTVPIGIYGQTLDDLLGNILRIDPRHGDPYAIPPDNPFVDTPGARPEIVAYGFRNPWRFWIDPQTDTMLIGDVGQESREEIDLLPLDQLGANFGWPCLEGTIVPPGVAIPASCAAATLTPPIYSYPHSATRCSITGGVVARDPRLPLLAGLYLWADLCDSHLYAIDPTSATPSPLELDLPSITAPTSFGTDGEGRIYVMTAGGQLYRLDPAA